MHQAFPDDISNIFFDDLYNEEDQDSRSDNEESEDENDD